MAITASFSWTFTSSTTGLNWRRSAASGPGSPERPAAPGLR
jgi:hypothetical protein